MKNKFSNFFEGLGSILNLYPSKNTRQINLPKTSIRDALQQDWEKVGMDMWSACGRLDEKEEEM